MADSDADRQRRRRAHANGDHRLCRPARCRDAGAAPVNQTPNAEAALAGVPAALFSSAPPAATTPPQSPAPPAALAASASAVGGAPAGGASTEESEGVAAAIRADIEAMEELVGIEGSLAAMAIRLGVLIDEEVDPKVVATLIREARTTLTDLTLSLSPRNAPAERPALPESAGEVNNDAADGWSGMDKPS